MSAFTNQPGGCCCVGGKYYDCYGYTNPDFDYDNTGTLHHVKVPRFAPTLRGPGTGFDSSDPTLGIGWSADFDYHTPFSIGPGVHESMTGFPAFGSRWWQIENRYSPTSQYDVYLACYDSASKTVVSATKHEHPDTLSALTGSAAITGAFGNTLAPGITYIDNQSVHGDTPAGTAWSQDRVINFELNDLDHPEYAPVYFSDIDVGGNASYTQITGGAVKGEWEFSTVNVGPDSVPIDLQKATYTACACLAHRNAPQGAGSKTVIWSTPGGNDFTNDSSYVVRTVSSKLFIGDVGVSDGILTCSQGTTVLDTGDQPITLGPASRPDNVTVYEWLHFDSSPTHWAGVVLKRIGAYWSPPYTKNFDINGPNASYYNKFGEPWYVPHQASMLLMIDGQIVQEIQLPCYASPLNIWTDVHVCHPHETLGDGFVAVGTNEYLEYTATSNTNNIVDVDPNKPYRVVIYKDGARLWATPRIPPQVGFTYEDPPYCDQSGDRWLYISDRTNGDLPTNPIHDRYRHDGSLHFRSGTLSPDGTTTIAEPHIYTPVGGSLVPTWHTVRRFHGVVQNSASIPGTLPLDFPEFDDSHRTSIPLTPALVQPPPLACDHPETWPPNPPSSTGCDAFMNGCDNNFPTPLSVSIRGFADQVQQWQTVSQPWDIIDFTVAYWDQRLWFDSVLNGDYTLTDFTFTPIPQGRALTGLSTAALGPNNRIYFVPLANIGDYNNPGKLLQLDVMENDADGDFSKFHYETYLTGIYAIVSCNNGLGSARFFFEYQTWRGNEDNIAGSDNQKWPPLPPDQYGNPMSFTSVFEPLYIRDPVNDVYQGMAGNCQMTSGVNHYHYDVMDEGETDGPRPVVIEYQVFTG